MLILREIENKIQSSEVQVKSDDELYKEARDLVVKKQIALASYLQSSLRIGYARASKILSLLESKGVIGPQNGAKPRKVLVKE